MAKPQILLILRLPQGSILGPLLFLVCIGNITEGIKSDIILFADDTSLLDIIDDPVLSARRLNNDLERLHIWSSKWLVTFNPAKPEVLTFSNKRSPENHPTLFLNNNPLNEVSSHTHLGLCFTNNLSWSKHINTIVTRSSQRVNILKHLKFLLGKNTLIHLYKTMIRHILEYGCIVFDNCSSSVQYEAARVCTGALWNTNKLKLLEELGWSLMSKRRKYFKLCMFFQDKTWPGPHILGWKSSIFCS